MMAYKTFHTQPVNIFTIHPYTKSYTSSHSRLLVYATQPKVKLKFSHSCKVVLRCTKLTSRKTAYFSKNHYHNVLYTSTEWWQWPYKLVCLPCFHYRLHKSYKYMVGVACVSINIFIVSWFNSWKDGVPIYSICTANYTGCAVSMLNTPCFKCGMCLTTSLPSILYFSNDNESMIRMQMRCVNSSVCSNTTSSLCKSTTKSTLVTNEQGWDSKDEIKNYIIYITPFLIFNPNIPFTEWRRSVAHVWNEVLHRVKEQRNILHKIH